MYFKNFVKIFIISLVFLFTGSTAFAGVFGSIDEIYLGSVSLDDAIVGSKFYLSERGRLEKISAHLTINGTSSAVVGIYNESGNLIAQSSERSWDLPVQYTWFDFTFEENPNLTTGNYWLVAWSDTASSVYISKADPSTLETYRQSMVYSDSLPTSYAGTWYQATNIGINATYVKYLVVPTDLPTSIIAYAGQLFTDLNLVVILAIGLPLGFWVIKKIISLV